MRQAKKYDFLNYDIIMFKNLTENQLRFEHLLQINSKPFSDDYYSDIEDYKNAVNNFLLCSQNLDLYCKKFNIKRDNLYPLKYNDRDFISVKHSFKHYSQKQVTDFSVKNVVYLLYIDEWEEFENNYSLILPFYVGQTSGPISKRFSEHKMEINKKLLLLKKYGVSEKKLKPFFIS
ncbi:hypothetical protein [Mesoplasma florum]|uniref:hypothetical protein n=1 Tax=Mesoplasma florum TaxID=2151 RepID=UPI000D086A61|nr:hypothetical protein [Mesoplasma florum]AVN61121.1 hypothetical protein CG005_02380 [Mesoplasma florum]